MVTTFCSSIRPIYALLLLWWRCWWMHYQELQPRNSFMRRWLHSFLNCKSCIEQSFHIKYSRVLCKIHSSKSDHLGSKLTQIFATKFRKIFKGGHILKQFKNSNNDKAAFGFIAGGNFAKWNYLSSANCSEIRQIKLK